MSVQPLTKASCVFLVGMISCGVPSMSIADDITAGELQHCSAIDDSSLRLACYDRLSGRQESAPIAPAARPEPTADDFGSESLPRDRKDNDEKLAIEVRVTRCTKNSRKKYFFYFDNGQVWKQASDKRLYFRDCDFNVTITKDYFGYKMQQEGEKRRIRISRIK